MNHTCEYCTTLRSPKRRMLFHLLQASPNMVSTRAARQLGTNRNTIMEWREEGARRGCIPPHPLPRLPHWDALHGRADGEGGMKPRPCACCGHSFTPRHGRQTYINHEHHKKARRDAYHRAVIEARAGKPCACGCGATLPKKNPNKTWASKRCMNRAEARRRTARRQADKDVRHPNTILIWQLRREMDAAGKKGCCIYCERKLPQRRTHICTDDECARLYNSDWKRGRTMLQRQQAA